MAGKLRYAIFNAWFYGTQHTADTLVGLGGIIMDESIKENRDYFDRIHFFGRIWMALALIMLLAIPAAISAYWDAWPRFSVLVQIMIGIAPTFWTVSTIQLFTFIPVVGAGGSYLGFITGNLINLKVPCAINAMNLAKVEPGTKEGELISTISIAVSSLVTTLLLTVGVFLLFWIRPLLESPVLAPAFENILPSLFGGMAVVMISRNWKIAVAPILVMAVLFIFVPGLADAIALMVPVGVIISIIAARVLYKKGWL